MVICTAKRAQDGQRADDGQHGRQIPEKVADILTYQRDDNRQHDAGCQHDGCVDLGKALGCVRTLELALELGAVAQTRLDRAAGMVVAVMVIVNTHRVFVQSECLVCTCTACAAVLLLTDGCVQQQDADGGVRQNASPTADDERHTVQNGSHIGNRDERSAVSLAGDQIVKA